MTPTMNPDEVRATLRKRGTRFVTISFIKRDGSLRKINGLLRTTRHMVGGDRGAAQSDVLKSNGLVAIYSLKDRGWRSFSENAVVSIV